LAREQILSSPLSYTDKGDEDFCQPISVSVIRISSTIHHTLLIPSKGFTLLIFIIHMTCPEAPDNMSEAFGQLVRGLRTIKEKGSLVCC